jgi:hypothetical protein
VLLPAQRLVHTAPTCAASLAWRSREPAACGRQTDTHDAHDTARNTQHSTNTTHTRRDDTSDLIGLILVKEVLQFWRCAHAPRVSQLCMRPLPQLPVTTPMFDMLRYFQARVVMCVVAVRVCAHAHAHAHVHVSVHAWPRLPATHATRRRRLVALPHTSNTKPHHTHACQQTGNSHMALLTAAEGSDLEALRRSKGLVTSHEGGSSDASSDSGSESSPGAALTSGRRHSTASHSSSSSSSSDSSSRCVGVVRASWGGV